MFGNQLMSLNEMMLKQDEEYMNSLKQARPKTSKKSSVKTSMIEETIKPKIPDAVQKFFDTLP